MPGPPGPEVPPGGRVEQDGSTESFGQVGGQTTHDRCVGAGEPVPGVLPVQAHDPPATVAGPQGHP